MANALHPYLARREKPRVFAHRGLLTAEMRAEGIADNTIAAFAAANAAGANYIETDCHLTSDGAVVLIHDDDLVRVADDPRHVADVPLAELEEIMASRGGLATLAQALETFPAARFNVDVKTESAATEVGRIVAPHADRVLLTSFSDDRRAKAMRAAARAAGSPAASAGLRTIATMMVLTRVLPWPWLIRRVLRGIDALQIPEKRGRFRVLTPRLLRAAHAVGVEVHVWTVNDPDDMRRLVADGVDGIVTDRADAALDALRS